MAEQSFPFHLVPHVGIDPTELAAIYEQKTALEMVLLAALDDGYSLSSLTRMLTRIALLSADLRRN